MLITLRPRAFCSAHMSKTLKKENEIINHIIVKHRTKACRQHSGASPPGLSNVLIQGTKINHETETGVLSDDRVSALVSDLF